MLKVTPIMIFTGQANQAIKLYEKAFGAEVKVKLLFSDMHSDDWQCSDEEKDMVAHSEIKIGGHIVMLADDATNLSDTVVQKKPAKSFSIDLLVNFDSDNELKAAYEVLSDGATVTDPLCSTTYCSLCVTLIDKYGGRWQLMSGYAG